MRKLQISCCFGLLISSMLAYADSELYSMYPPEIGDLSAKSVRVNQYNWRKDVADAEIPAGVADLPIPQLSESIELHLSMREAILLSLRNNPSIQSTEMNRVTDKFALILAHNGFEPQYNLGFTGRLTKNTVPQFSSTAGVSLKNRMGTNFQLAYSNTYTGGGGPGQTSFTISQPLMRGFGTQLNTISWYNALDSENSARLGFKGSIMTQVVAVISAYRKLIEDYTSLDIQRRTLKNNIETVKQSELKLKVGKIARSDVLQQQATLETTKLSMLTQQSSFIQDYQAFLNTLGLKATAKVIINKKVNFANLTIPSLKKCVRLALQGNIDYQKTLIGIRATQRAVITAKDAVRWQLDISGNMLIAGTTNPPIFTTNAAGVTTNTAVNQAASPNLTINFNIPINDIAAKQGVISAEIKLDQAKLALEQARLALVRQITNEVQQIQNQVLTIQSAQRQVDFQQASLNAAQIKYRFGRTTVFEVNQIQDQLLTQQTTLVSDKISLLSQITTLNQDLGLTLDKWDIKLRY